MFFRKNEDTRRIDRMQALLDAGMLLTFSLADPEGTTPFRDELDAMLDHTEAGLRYKEGLERYAVSR